MEIEISENLNSQPQQDPSWMSNFYRETTTLL